MPPTTLGDPMLKLFRELPLAVRLDLYSSYKQDAVAEADFEWPWSMKLLSGGPISEKISYYFYAHPRAGGVDQAGGHLPAVQLGLRCPGGCGGRAVSGL